MNNSILLSLLLIILFITTLSYKYINNVNFKYKKTLTTSLYDNDKDKDNLEKWFNEELKEGTTHIKYNKYAPSSEEAKNMTSVEFRKVIFDKMMKAEELRRKESGGLVGNAASDSYLNALESKDTSIKKKNFNPFKK